MLRGTHYPDEPQNGAFQAHNWLPGKETVEAECTPVHVDFDFREMPQKAPIVNRTASIPRSPASHFLLLAFYFQKYQQINGENSDTPLRSPFQWSSLQAAWHTSSDRIMHFHFAGYATISRSRCHKGFISGQALGTVAYKSKLLNEAFAHIGDPRQ